LPSTFNDQVNTWCLTCHTRYLLASSTGSQTPQADAIFTFRHSTRSDRVCTTCHVAHGSNAAMTGPYSMTFPYPDGTESASSRLLKFDNRGTCQACHDPTETVVAGDTDGDPAPIVPAPAP
jgi:D-tyrosyl-tRNA(Tyr) deacylase